MPELRLVLYIAVYLVLGYLVLFVPLVWLATKGEPDLRSFLDLALKPVLLPLGYLLRPFGVNLQSRTELREPTKREPGEEKGESAATIGTSGRFRSQKQAKEYLVGRIVDEAEREGVPLSEIELKMLYFSETDWTLPDILDVNSAFERDCDENEYEQKIAVLVRNLQQKATAEEQEAWDDAATKLADGDHYLLILIEAGSPSGATGALLGKLSPWLPSANGSHKRPPGDFLRLIVVGVGLGVLLLIAMVIAAKLR